MNEKEKNDEKKMECLCFGVVIGKIKEIMVILDN